MNLLCDPTQQLQTDTPTLVISRYVKIIYVCAPLFMMMGECTNEATWGISCFCN